MKPILKNYIFPEQGDELGFGDLSGFQFFAVMLQCSDKNIPKLERGISLLSENSDVYLFQCEGKFSQNSKRRDYLGAFGRKNIIPNMYSEHKIERFGSLSIFAGMRKISAKYFTEDKRQHYNFSRSFFVCGSEKSLSLISKSEDYLTLTRSHVRVNYEDLVATFDDETLIKYWRVDEEHSGFIIGSKSSAKAHEVSEYLLANQDH